MATLSVEELTQRVQSLESELDEERNNVTQAAKIGKVLLEDNQELTQRIEQMERDHIARIEDLEQEKYSMQLKLNSKQNVEENCSDEVESLRCSLKQQRQEFEAFRDNEHLTKMAENRKQISGMQADLDKKQLHCSQLEEKCTQLQEQLQEAQEQLRGKLDAMNETCSDELVSLHNEVHALQAQKLTLTNSLNDSEAKCQEMALGLSQKEAQLKEQEQEIEEKQCQATSYYNALERAREEAQELKIQMDIITMECQSQKSKGNSLFSEVEDRRVEAEKELISVKVQCQSLESQLQHSREQLHKLKLQFSAALQMSGCRADATRLNSLEQELTISRSEVRDLTEKLQKLEKDQKIQKMQTEDLSGRPGEPASSAYVKSLYDLVQFKDTEMEKLKKEVSMERRLRLSESDRVIQGQRKLYEAECNVEKLQHQNMKLHLQHEAMCMKYEPDTLKNIQRKKRVYAEKIPDDTEEKKKNENATTEDEPIIKSGKMSPDLGDPEEAEVKATEPLLENKPHMNTKTMAARTQRPVMSSRKANNNECKQQ